MYEACISGRRSTVCGCKLETASECCRSMLQRVLWANHRMKTVFLARLSPASYTDGDFIRH